MNIQHPPSPRPCERYESKNFAYVCSLISRATELGFTTASEMLPDGDGWYVEVYDVSSAQMTDLLRRAATFKPQSTT